MIMSTVYIIIIIAALVGSSVHIDLRQERAKKVGKLKHGTPMLVLNMVSYCGLISLIHSGWAFYAVFLIMIVFTLPLFDIPYNGKYNKRFGTAYNFLNKVKAILLTAVILLEVFNWVFDF